MFEILWNEKQLCVNSLENQREDAGMRVIQNRWSWSFFAYKSISIHGSLFADTALIDSHTSKSIRVHWKKKCSHKHSNRIAIGQRNKLNLKFRLSYLLDQRANDCHDQRLCKTIIIPSHGKTGKYTVIPSFESNAQMFLRHSWAQIL